jgi:hypothetical protein
VKIVAEIARANAGYECIIVDGILTGDCDIAAADCERRISAISKMADDWGLAFRIYRTRAGLRPICVSHLFRPLAPITEKILTKMGTDPLYLVAVKKQLSFICRTTPKPERVGIERPSYYSMLPREQEAWVSRYEAARQGYKTCSFLSQTSECEMPSQIANFIKLHDERTGCELDLPLA